MRLIALLPDLWVMARPVAQIAAIALFLGGLQRVRRPGRPAGRVSFDTRGPIYLRMAPVRRPFEDVPTGSYAARICRPMLLERTGASSDGSAAASSGFALATRGSVADDARA